MRIPTNSLRARRDIGKLVAAIKVCAWLHQFQRATDEQGRILATEADFEKARELLKPALIRAHQGVTPSEERVLEAISKLPKDKQEDFQRSDLAPFCDMPVRTVKACLKSLSESGFLDCDYRAGRTGNRYAVVRKGAPGTPEDPFEISLARLPINLTSNSNALINIEETAHYETGNEVLPTIENPLPATAHSDDSSGGGTVASETASVPFMITKAMRERLRECGETDAEIDAMTPAQAHKLLEIFRQL